MKMEEFVHEQKKVEKEGVIEGVSNKYWKRHLGMVVLSAIMAYLPERQVDASELSQQTVATETAGDTMEARRLAFEKLREIIEGENIEEKIFKLKQMYGRSIDDFLFVNRIERDISTYKIVKADVDKDATWVNSKDVRAMTIGSVLSQRFHDSWEKKVSEKKQIKFINIEKVPGLSEEELVSFLEESYPGSRVSDSVASIEFVEQSMIQGDRQILGTTQVYGFDSMSRPGGGGRIEIKINLPLEGITKEEFLSTLCHETGHSVDWTNSRVKTSQDRVNMALEVGERLSSHDRYKSEYVESWIDFDSLDIHADTRNLSEEDKRQMLAYIKSFEYWAEIYRHYKDVGFKESYPKDYELVMRWGDMDRK